MKRLRHVDVTMTLTLSDVVIHGLPGGGLSFYCQVVENVFADDKLFVHYIPKTAWQVSNTCTCFKKSKRGISVIC